MSKIKHFEIKGDYITLSQFLKEESIISSGGQAKWFLQEHPVQLNGEGEQRRGKKLHPGDHIFVGKQEYQFVQGQ